MKKNNNYLQDKNAGNLGDYLKHFWLLKLIENLRKKYSASSIAYIESHAGAGKYILQDSNRRNCDKYRKLICENKNQWKKFDSLNPYLDKKIYFGSFVLAGKMLAGIGNKAKMVLYEKNDNAFQRMRTSIHETVPYFNVNDNEKSTESTPDNIKNRIKQLKSEFDIVICLIDPYWQDGTQDKVWCNILSLDIPNCYILVFDTARGRGKDSSGNIKFVLHCPSDKCIRSVEDGIKKYAIFGNELTVNQLR